MQYTIPKRKVQYIFPIKNEKKIENCRSKWYNLYNYNSVLYVRFNGGEIVAEIQEYKCPCCGGAIAFDSASQKMKCPYCDTEFEVETLREYDATLKNTQNDDMNWEEASGGEWQPGEADGLRVYSCKSCGGEIIGDENMAATDCPFCGNHVVMMGQFKGELRPDYVIPFKLDKKAAKEGLMKHLSGKRLLPKIFKDKNHIDEIKGVYVPFWLYDTEADALLNFKATKVRSWSDRNYNYVETSHYSVTRGGTIAFDNVPVDGSTKMPDDLMDSIEPYDYKEAVDFQTAYLAGYLADKYDLTAKDCEERANARVKKSAETAFAATAEGYTTITPENTSVKLNAGKVRYALLPVWILNTTWNGNKYIFAMNGQTGKFVGNLPIDKKAASLWRLGLTLGIGALIYGCAWLLWLANIL